MNKRIFIIDDDPLIRKIAESRLIKEGFQVFTAEDGKDALGKLSIANPDLIVLDVEMPRVNGYTFMMRLKEMPQYRFVPVIVLTAHADKQPIFQLKGVQGYLIKPLNPDNLLIKIKEVFCPVVPVKKEEKVVFVESNSTMKTLMTHFVGKASYEHLVVCETGQSGIDKVLELNADFAVVDVNLPDISGYDVCKKIKEKEGLKTKVVIVASQVEQIDHEKVIEVGAIGFVVKTPDFASLVELLDTEREKAKEPS